MSYQDFPPSLLRLSPRLTRTGDPSASLQGINTTELGDGCWCYCVENKGEYQLDKQDNSTPPDGNLVIAPTAGPGRWFKRLPAGASALVQTGFDQPDATAVYGVVAGFASVLVRDGASAPLQVRLPKVTPGNILIVDFSAQPSHVLETSDLPNLFLPVVSFNGNANYAPGNGFFQIDNAISYGFRPTTGLGTIPGTVRCYAAIVIPSPATDAIVQVAYTSASAFNIQGRSSFTTPLPSATLSATEMLAGAVPQPGPSTLVSF